MAAEPYPDRDPPPTPLATQIAAASALNDQLCRPGVRALAHLACDYLEGSAG